MCNTGPKDPPTFLSAWFSSTSFQFWGSLGNLPQSQTYKQQAWGGMGSICLLAFMHHLEDSRPPGIHWYRTKNLFYKTHVWDRAAVLLQCITNNKFRLFLRSSSLLCKNAVQTRNASTAGHKVKEGYFYRHKGGKRKGHVPWGWINSTAYLELLT